MKIVRFQGGFGNQMFQYAFLVALQEKFQEEILADITMFDHYETHDFCLVDFFGMELKLANSSDLNKVTRYSKTALLQKLINKYLSPKNTVFYEKTICKFDKSSFDDINDRYYVGYWINTDYFNSVEAKIRKSFVFKRELDIKNQQVMYKISKSESVSIHVRRTNYIPTGDHLECPLEYYKAAIDYIAQNKGNVSFFVFSDDIAWCKENFPPLMGDSACLFIDWNNERESHYIDMQLMAACRNNILANSTFSWWGAWLNTNSDKIVTVPKKWAERLEHDKGLILQDWKVL